MLQYSGRGIRLAGLGVSGAINICIVIGNVAAPKAFIIAIIIMIFPYKSYQDVSDITTLVIIIVTPAISMSIN